MLLFIISEVMVFGAFFTAYFFIRVAQGDPWPAHGTTLPDARSGWMRANLIERVQGATATPVEHVVVDMPSTAAAPAA